MERGNTAPTPKGTIPGGTRPPGPSACDTCGARCWTDADEARHVTETGHTRYLSAVITDCTEATP